MLLPSASRIFSHRSIGACPSSIATPTTLRSITRSSGSTKASATAPQLHRRSLLGSAILGGSLLGGFMQNSGLTVATASSGSKYEKVLDDPKYPENWPFSPEDFARFDELPDGLFYSYPRLVTHIDQPAIGALTKFYSQVFPESGRSDTALLDVCSSWVSHYPPGYKAAKVAGLGMNAEELKRNTQLTEWTVRDLNLDPTLPYPDNTFDVITNCVSVDYLTKPLEIFKEMRRVLKPGGTAYMSFSNRCFPTKATQIWTSTSDIDHVWLVGAFYHYAGGYTPARCSDISPNPGRSDPMYVVHASKTA
ncbi:ubiquinone/menaquinone biosynthesis methyltransferase-like protein [Dunaliella salina]|uniref:Ubiquinone/menaquinone biosynthesis methyltransferase-like protein n=1 Tax=Dunaliella salina TaxID=3046 RepID=A0ABQ7H0G6_DUNSA|nr:ubiquinone/menaquinone biosynthesis methyltransferase-like protein [Dunaliella salina]|eukprot:KAF5840343.1 ubiquinone/menaquinone biosynthesis methyltransferase-like protein [Dunaliella salina]